MPLSINNHQKPIKHLDPTYIYQTLLPKLYETPLTQAKTTKFFQTILDLRSSENELKSSETIYIIMHCLRLNDSSLVFEASPVAGDIFHDTTLNNIAKKYNVIIFKAKSKDIQRISYVNADNLLYQINKNPKVLDEIIINKESNQHFEFPINSSNKFTHPLLINLCQNIDEMGRSFVEKPFIDLILTPKEEIICH